jgi:hypothetical protein
MDPVADRRQRAREAAQDECPNPYVARDAQDGIEAAIEVATQVKITDDIYTEFVERTKTGTFHDGVIAAFRAAGFEVVE